MISWQNQQRLAWCLLAAFTALFFWSIVREGVWPFDANGQLKTLDFSSVWAAGKRAVAGQAALAYNVAAHDAFQGELRNVPPPDGLSFGYPPGALLLSALLAPFSYAAGYILLTASSLALFFAVLWRITRDPVTAGAMSVAIGGPTQTIHLGQNGFITATLVSFGLMGLKRFPALAGVAIGLLTLKPQLAVLCFLALLWWREWRALTFALGTAATLLILPTLVFGLEIWTAYLGGSAEIAKIVASKEATLVARMMQSVFALLVGGQGTATAFAVQGASAVFALLAVSIIPAHARDQRAAGVIAATMLATPYLFLYDATMLLVAAALLLRNSRSSWLLVGVTLSIAFTGSWFLQWGSKVPLTALMLLVVAVAQGRTLDKRHVDNDGGR